MQPTRSWLCSQETLCIAESGPLVSDSEVLAVLGHNVLPVFRLLHAQVAAAAAVLSQNIRMATGHIPVRHTNTTSLPPLPACQNMPLNHIMMMLLLCVVNAVAA